MSAQIACCVSCGYSYQLGPETIVFLYSLEPEYNHLVTFCPRTGCGASATVWDLLPEAVNRLVRIALPSESSVLVIRRSVASPLDRIRWANHHAVITQYTDRFDLLIESIPTVFREDTT